MGKKARFYVYILIVLWGSALLQNVSEYVSSKKQEAQAAYLENENIIYRKYYDGELTMKQKKALEREQFDNIDGEVAYAIRTDDLYTVYGYTERIDDYLYTQNKKINLNLIVTYDEENDCSMIGVATPIWNEDY